MVRNYVKTTGHQQWTNESLQRAVVEVNMNKMSCKTAAECFNIPRSTLQRYLKNTAQNPNQPLNVIKVGNFKPVFSALQENDLCEYLKMMEARLFGLSLKELRQLAFELAEKNGLTHNFDPRAKIAGEDWARNFLKRNPIISLRKPEATSEARAMGFNRVAVSKFYELLQECVDKYNITSSKIFNVDETGITTVAKSLGKILATKGRKQVGSLSSAERGQLLTVKICCSADGSYMPPMFIFPRERMKAELLDGTPPNSWAECNKNGWITKELFLKWFNRFVEWSRATKEQPVLLLLDGHASHVKSLELIDTAREKGVVLLCFPPHCTHRLKPLDVSFMKPLSTYYGDEVKKWLRSHPGRTVTHYQVGSLFGNAFLRAATMSVAINGFRKTGIWPVDPNVFDEHDFLAAETTNIPAEEEPPEASHHTQNATMEIQPQTPHMNPSTPLLLPTTPVQRPSTPVPPLPTTPMPSNSTSPQSLPMANQSVPSTSFQNFSPSQILPIPKAPAKQRISRRRGKTAIITSSPYKRELESQSDETKKRNKTKKIVKKAEKVKKSRKKVATDDFDSTGSEDEECLYCGRWYSQSTESWVSCRACGKWAHCSCAGEDDNDDESSHMCSFCARF